jgi:hypothetical protein
MRDKLKLAIVIGVSNYLFEHSLIACKKDADLIKVIFERLHKFDDICFLNDSPKGKDAKQRITDFVNSHKGKQIDELVFYYSGHGARFDDDFFYIFSDFKADKREVTGLRNTELDGLLRNLEPELTVKIVDACYSGSMYIKSDGDIKPLLEKSARENNLKKVYFLHSSSEAETSIATQDYSFFTHSFLESLTQEPGQIRYRDIMAFVADNMAAQGLPKPVFVVQADNTEIFGTIDADLINFTKSTLAINEGVSADAAAQIESRVSLQDELLQLVKTKSVNEFCTRGEVDANLSTVNGLLSSQKWPPNVCSLFDIDLAEIENTANIANAVAIGTWLKKNEAENYFATPRYEKVAYEVEEYRVLPKRPISSSNSFLANARVMSRLIGGEDENEYKLEKVKKTKSVINGFLYSVDPPFKSVRLSFTPRYTALENYSLAIVIIFSRKVASIFYSIEHLALSDWDTLKMPKSEEWKNKTAPLKASEEIENAINVIITDASAFLLSDVNARLAK